MLNIDDTKSLFSDLWKDEYGTRPSLMQTLPFMEAYIENRGDNGFATIDLNGVATSVNAKQFANYLSVTAGCTAKAFDEDTVLVYSESTGWIDLATFIILRMAA
jgi:hypothetical protein